MCRAAVRAKCSNGHRLYANKPGGCAEDGEREDRQRVEGAPGFLLLPDLKGERSEEKRTVKSKSK